MIPLSEDGAVSLALLRNYGAVGQMSDQTKADQGELGTWTGGGTAETFRERYRDALDDLEATLDELVRESAE